VLIGNAILVEASLSFLGYGVPPPFPPGERCSIPAHAHMRQAPLRSIWPGVAVSMIDLCFNVLGDGLRDVLGPRLRGSR
jgi:peptide/nickel transport system permease protein